VMHRLPQYWDRPDEFVPERFVGVDPRTYSHKYLPFLKGSRDCLGKYFAILEAILAIAALVQRYDMTCMDPNEKLGFRQTSHPYGGAQTQLKLREKNSQ
jgi:cytochrome P450